MNGSPPNRKRGSAQDTFEVNKMKTYPDLWELLRSDAEASELFASLPMYIRTSMNDRPNAINSIASLRSYADNLLSGDK